ncbi:uncharacterized protein LOC134261288 isoform X2 [Saccostrea cucullata]|uniref:uncharacterized protein LOC134261288 isoform X2 n=1 Tax=Saccostrea cuccullata TaxID=36930 RepID=UPI002ED61BDC
MDCPCIVLLILVIFQIRVGMSPSNNVDKLGDSELKVLTDMTQPTLLCVSILTVLINTTEGSTVDLYDYFSDADNITYSPGRYVTVNISTLGKLQQVSGTLEKTSGIEPSCTFLIYTKAEVCFTESLSSDAHATKVCFDSNGNKTCTYTCNSGYLYFDGSSSKTYTCSGKNYWSPSFKQEECLLTESPSYKAKLEMVYALGDLPASSCLQGFDNSLAAYNTTIAQKVDIRCDGFGTGKFKINSFTSTTKAFQITTVFSGEFTGTGSDESRSLCLRTLVVVVGNDLSSFLHNNTVVCDGRGQSSVSVVSIREVDSGNVCSDNMVLIKPTTSGSSEQCVLCPPGRYFNGTYCVMCADGLYQDSVGKAFCNTCPTNTVSGKDKTACIDLCPPGFTSSDGMTECKPCSRDEYWVNATNCERCPADFSTFGKNGISDISGCEALCSAGRYSNRGFEPCQDCPFHHYKTVQGQGNCTQCPNDWKTLSTGSKRSADCINVDFLNRDLLCSSDVTISINSKEDTKVDLHYYYFSAPYNITYNPGRYIFVNTSTLGKPQRVTGSFENKLGMKETCTFLIYTKAVICFIDTLKPVQNAKKTCSSFGGITTCTYTCKSGYIYYDGSSSKAYTCSLMNDWSASMYPEDCLLKKSPSYKAKLEVVYGLGDHPASQCLQGFDNSLAVYNTTIAQKVDTRCDGFGAGKFKINSFTSTSKAYQITTVFSGEFTASGSDGARSTCLGSLVIVVNNNPSYFLHNNTVVCDGGTQSSVSIKSIREIDSGNECSDNMVLIKPTTSGSSEQCVHCPPGMYFNGTNCVLCADDRYQDSEGQTFCKTCPTNTVSRNDKSACIDLCPPGFTSSDGMTQCKPCGTDEYWVNATNCESCPTGFKTNLQNGVPDISGCKDFCVVGTYSTSGMPPCNLCPRNTYWVNNMYCHACPSGGKTASAGSPNNGSCIAKCSTGTYSFDGFAPCSICPLNHYQDQTGATSCIRCPDEKYTVSVGSSSLSNCTDIIALCPAGKYSFTGYEPCQVCPLHHYKATEGSGNCTECPQNQGTLTTGSNSSTNCVSVASCPAGKYSLTGYEPCQDCPFHHYKATEGPGNCTECPQNQGTLTTGSKRSTDCVSVETYNTSPFPGTTKEEDTSTSGEKTLDDLSGKDNTDDNYFNYFIIISILSVVLFVFLLVVVALLLRRKFRKKDSENSNYTNPSLDNQESQTHSYSGLHDYSEPEESGGYMELDTIQREAPKGVPSIYYNRDVINTGDNVANVKHEYTYIVTN